MVANNAGKPATPADLINVDEVIGKYYDLVPDPAVPEQRVIFGTSGHRGSSLKTSFNEAHIVAITQAIAEYRKKAGAVIGDADVEALLLQIHPDQVGNIAVVLDHQNVACHALSLPLVSIVDAFLYYTAPDGAFLNFL